MLYPLQALNLNILQVRGRTDLYLKLVIINKLLLVPSVVIGLIYGIIPMLCVLLGCSLITYLSYAFCSGALIDYHVKEQILDIMPSFLLSLVTSIPIYILSIFLPYSSFPILCILICIGALLLFAVSEIIRHPDYLFLKSLLMSYKPLAR
jgi:O-antigen/teichoic acid export membrane protein